MAQQDISYVEYDFDALLLQLQNRLALQSAWKDMYRSATGSMLLELFAAVGTLVLYYVERRAEESYIGTAQNKSSLVNLVRLLNYTPSRNTSSTGTLRFSIAVASSETVFINSLTSDNPMVCSTSGGVNFLVSTDATILPGQTYVDVSGIQGVLVTKSYTSTGATGQEYAIDDTEIENTNVFVYVNDVLWTKVDSFLDSVTTSTDYMIRSELNDTITIVFGNDVFGKAPDIGDVIDVKYVQSDGLDGNVYSTGLITTVLSTVYDSASSVVVVTVTNTSNFLGGDDADTAEDIRSRAPNVFATGDRLVTKSDFVAAINDYPSVADSNVWGENEESAPNYDMYNQVKIVAVLQNWILPDATFEAALSEYLYEKSLMTVRYSFVDADILEIIPTLVIKVIKGQSLSYIESLVETAVQGQFVLGDTSKLGTSIYQSDVINAIANVSGVSYCHVTLKIRKELLSGYNSTYDWAETVTALPVLAGSVEIYIDDTQIAVDDGAGGFTPVSSTYVISGLVNYTTGFVGVTFSPTASTGSTVYVRYQQDEDGNLVVTKEQICRWIEDDYTSIGYAS